MSKTLAVCSLALSFAFAVFASDWDKRTVITLNEPLIVSGVPVVTLEPGKYVMRLLNSPSNRTSFKSSTRARTSCSLRFWRFQTISSNRRTKRDSPFGRHPAGIHPPCVPGFIQETTSARSSCIRRVWQRRSPKKLARR